MESRCTINCCFLTSYKKVIVSAIILSVLFLTCGCGKKQTDTYYVRENLDLNYIQKVALLPFANNTTDDYAARRLRDITATQILNLGLFDVVEEGLVDSALKEMAIKRDTPLDVFGTAAVPAASVPM